jgi:predicted transcriptional regulator
MDIQASKIELVKRILTTDDVALIEKINHLLDEESELTATQKSAINAALEELERGETIPHELVMEETRKRYPKYFR